MDPMENGIGGLRLSFKQVQSLLTAMTNTSSSEVVLSRGEDGRLIAKQVVKTEKLRALKIS